jgi:mycothiol synthase
VERRAWHAGDRRRGGARVGRSLRASADKRRLSHFPQKATDSRSGGGLRRLSNTVREPVNESPYHVVAAASRADFEGCAAINNQVSPHLPVTAEQIEHELTSEPGRRLFLARVGGTAAGSGYVSPSSAGPRALYAMVRVVPELRGRGIGRALYEALSDHGRELGCEWLWGRVRDDDAESLSIVLAHGFTETGRQQMVAVDPRQARRVGAPPEGVEIVSLADRPELARGAWEVECEAVEDVPAPEPPTSESFERFAADNLEGPAALPAGCFVALVDGEVVGHTGLAALPAPPHAAENLFTGVRRAWRGRGIATALKQAQIAWARAHGYQWMQTENDELSTLMRGINARLGYQPVTGSILVRGPLS